MRFGSLAAATMLLIYGGGEEGRRCELETFTPTVVCACPVFVHVELSLLCYSDESASVVTEWQSRGLLRKYRFFKIFSLKKKPGKRHF